MPTVTVAGHGKITVTPGTETITKSYVTDFTETTDFTLADLGSKTQLKALKANGRCWFFANAPLIKFYLWDGVNDPLLTPFTPSLYSSEVVVQDHNAGTFSITWTHAVYGSVAVAGAITGDRLRLTGSITLGGAISGAYGVWGVSMPYLVLKPYEIPTKGQMYLATGEYGGRIYRNTTVNGAEVRHGYSNTRNLGRSSAAHPVHTGMQMMDHYHRGAKAGLLIRCSDTTGLFKELNHQGNGSQTITYVRQYPPDNCTVGTNWTSAYGVDLIPHKGGWYDGMIRLQQQDVTENTPAVSRGRLDAMIGVPNSAVSSVALNSGLLVWWNGDTSSATWAKYTTELQRVEANWGVVFPPISLIYRWHTNPFGEDWPYWTPELALAATFRTVSENAGWKTAFYTIPNMLGALSPWLTPGTPPAGYNAAYGAPLGYVCLDPTQTGYVDQLQAQGGDPTHGAHGIFNLGVTNARNHMIQQWWTTLDVPSTRGLLGVYMDAFSYTGDQDYRTALGAANRGLGTAYHSAGKKTFLSTYRSTARAAQAEFCLISEHACDFYNDSFDLMETVTYDVVAIQDYLPIFKTAYGPFQPTYGFDSYGLTTQIDSIVGDMVWNQVMHWHHGKPQMMIPNNSATTGPYMVPQAGDSTYGYWQTYCKPIMDKVQKFSESWRSGPNMCRFFFGQRLRPLRNSYDEYQEDHGATLTLSVPALDPHFEESEVIASAWQGTGIAGDPVRILISNTTGSTQTWTLTMTPEEHPEIVGKTTLSSINWTTGAATLIQNIYGPFSYTVTLTARQEIILEVA